MLDCEPDKVLQLKADGDASFKQSNYRDAWESYTKALQDLGDTHGELWYILLSNRCAAFTKGGRTVEALEDAHVLQTRRPDWPKSWFRGAKALEEAKQYLAAMHQYAQACRLAPLGSRQAETLQQHMQRCAARLTLPEMGQALLSMLASKPAGPQLQHHQSQSTPDAVNLPLVSAHLPLSSVEASPTIPGAELVQTAELQEACFQVVKQLKTGGQAHGFPLLVPRFVGWVRDGGVGSCELPLLRAQILLLLKLWAAAAVHAQEAVDQTQKALTSMHLPDERDKWLDQLALAHHVLGLSQLNCSRQSGAAAQTDPHTQATPAQLSTSTWQTLFFSGLVNLAVACELCPENAGFLQSLNCDDVQLMGGHTVCHAVRAARRFAQQIMAGAPDGKEDGQEDVGGYCGQGTTATLTCTRHGLAAAPDIKELPRVCTWQCQPPRDMPVLELHLSLSLAYPAASKGALTATARKALFSPVQTALCAVALHTHPSDSGQLDQLIKGSTAVATTTTRLIDVMVLLDAVKLPGHVKLTAQVRAQTGLDTAAMQFAASQIASLQATCLRAPEVVLANLRGQLCTLCSADLSRLGSLDLTASSCVLTSVLASACSLLHSDSSSTHSAGPEASTPVTAGAAGAAGAACTPPTLQLAAAQGTELRALVLQPASQALMSVAPHNPRQPVLQTPYLGYSLVDGLGRAVERSNKHAFALSRVFYTAEELPDNDQQVWFQPVDGQCRWRQTASELVIIPTQVPVGLSAKQLTVDIQPFSLVVQNRVTGAVYLSGHLERGVLPAESTWWCDHIAASALSALSSKPDASALGQAKSESHSGSVCTISLVKMNLELHAGTGHHAVSWWPRLMRHHVPVAWDDAHKDYTDLPPQVLERHALEEARVSGVCLADSQGREEIKSLCD